MLNYTRIPAPRVTLVDPQTGVVANEWFRFFNNLYTIAYSGATTTTAGTYGSASVVPQITINDFGGITAISNVPIAIDASQIVSGTIASARISGSYTGITGVGTLTVGTWNASAITTPYGGTGLTSYTAGDTLYYASGTALTKLAIGASTFINTSSGTAPQWTDPTTITIGKATNLVGGAANRIAYQTAADTTGFIVAPTVSDTYLNWSGTAFQWTANPLGTVTSVSVVSANGLAGTVATATTTPAITLTTTITGLLKGNGTAISAASSGTDYAPATSGTSILYGNGAGGFSNVTIGTGVSFAAGTLSATGSGGTVTSVTGTGTVNGITLTGTVTSSGSLTLGGTLSGIGNSQLTNSTISGVALGSNLFDLTAGTGVSFSVGTTYNGSAAITINATGSGGTVTSVAALTLGTTGTDLSSTVANGTTTPVITLQVPTASSVNRGALSAADWTTFNSKAPGVTFTTNYIPYGQGTTTLNQSAGLQFDGTNFTTTGSATATGFIPSSATIPTNGMYLPAANSVGFATNSTARMRIDATGNLGLGVTPAAWSGSGTIGFDIGTYASFAQIGATGGASVSSNAYFNGTNWIYRNTNQSTRYLADGSTGSHKWFLAASGTAGNVITYTQALTLNANGGLQTLNTIGVGNTTPSTSGAGITFPATQSASTDVNTLDDYEEGTWTIGISFGGASVGITASATAGTYTKIGNVVTVRGYYIMTNKGSSTGAARITGLPFTAAAPAAAYSGVTFGFFGNISFSGQLTSYVNVGATTCDLVNTTLAGVNSTVTNTNFANNSTFIMELTYAV